MVQQTPGGTGSTRVPSADDQADRPRRAEPPVPKRLVDRLDPRLVNTLTVLGFGLPLAAYVWLIAHDSVNVIVNDQWSNVAVIRQTWSHPFDWKALWAPHNENRIFFPNIIAVVLAHTVHFNIQVEEFLGGAMLVAATALLIWAHRRRSPSTPWLYYCPVAIVAFSLVQYGDTLWGFQVAWYLVLLSLAAVIVLLDARTLGWMALGGAVAAAVVGSYSLVQGLLIWPVGLILIYHRRRRWPVAVAWVACAAATVVLYYYNFRNKAAGAYPHFWSHYPLRTLKFFLFLVGDVVGSDRTARHPGNTAILAFGVVIVVLAVAVVLLYGIRRDEQGPGPIGVALICFGLLFALLVTQGRAYLGYVGASASRYTLFDLLILIGIYLALLGHPPQRSPAEPRSTEASPGAETHSPVRTPGRVLTWVDGTGLKWGRAVVIVAIVVQVAVGVPDGLRGAKGRHEYQVHAAYVLRNIDRMPDAKINAYLAFGDRDVYIRHLARVAMRYRLSLFADDPSRASP